MIQLAVKEYNFLFERAVPLAKIFDKDLRTGKGFIFQTASVHVAQLPENLAVFNRRQIFQQEFPAVFPHGGDKISGTEKRKKGFLVPE